MPSFVADHLLSLSFLWTPNSRRLCRSSLIACLLHCRSQSQLPTSQLNSSLPGNPLAMKMRELGRLLSLSFQPSSSNSTISSKHLVEDLQEPVFSLFLYSLWITNILLTDTPFLSAVDPLSPLGDHTWQGLRYSAFSPKQSTTTTHS